MELCKFIPFVRQEQSTVWTALQNSPFWPSPTLPRRCTVLVICGTIRQCWQCFVTFRFISFGSVQIHFYSVFGIHENVMAHNKRLTCGKSWLHLAISWQLVEVRHSSRGSIGSRAVAVGSYSIRPSESIWVYEYFYCVSSKKVSKDVTCSFLGENFHNFEFSGINSLANLRWLQRKYFSQLTISCCVHTVL